MCSKTVISLLVSLPLLGMGASVRAEAPAGSDWPYWLGPNQDGKSTDRRLLKEWPADGPKQLWKASGIGSGYSCVAVAGGKVFITGTDKGKGILSAFDMEGKLLWKADCGRHGKKEGFANSPTADGGNVYTLDGQGLLICHDAETGKKKWSREAREFGGGAHEWGYTESPLVLGDTVVFKPGGKNCIVAVDKTTGKDVWKSSGFAASPMYSSCVPFVFGDVPLLVTATDAGLTCVKAKTGELMWKNGSATAPWSVPTPVYGDGYVFWANGYGKGGFCMKLEDGGTAKEAWKTRDMECTVGSFIIDNGYVYGNNQGGWLCLDLKTGKKMWNERGIGAGSLCWADGMLYLFSNSGGQAALATCSPEGLKITGKVKLQGDGSDFASHPAVAGGRLYLRYGNSLYCFDVKAK